MRIVQINTVCGKGSTGRIAVDIGNASEARGHVCYIAYGYGKANYQHAYHIGNRFEQLFHNVFFTRLLGLHGFGSILATKQFTRWLNNVKPDVIHIHNLHSNYINYRILFQYIINNRIPVVFTLHDCFNFTGKCSHYTSVGCDKWKKRCMKCPTYRNTAAPSLLFDFSSFLYMDKKELYKKFNTCYIVSVSKWLKEEAELSILSVNKHVIGYIYNWVDYNTFTRASEESIASVYEKYSLSRDTKYLISVSQLWEKGSIRLEDAFALAKILPHGYKLILVGGLKKGTLIDTEYIHHIPYTSSQEELAALYSMAYAYVHFSVEDTFGLVIGEAMACGTIPITYNSTACSEIPGGYGIVVSPRDINAIVRSLPLIEEKQKHRNEMVSFVKTNYDKGVNTNKYVDIYERLF